ncbi:MAG: glycoside hydrolase family 99-like domain-containing protein [Salinisphaera sp.]|nr:glycoside hydrolase family 99-like domain-containing protein [Salinisphaera sp.]
MRAIAFYLPQYHPIPENDRWWGPGFTEWRNVARARPRFAGHHQPQIPERLGFYDLRLPQTRAAQAALAREHGIHGFCYYHFWFNGRRLLEQPLDAVLNSGRPDFPFCICWANENWTRRWDGGEHQVLLGQDYQSYRADAHIDWLAAAFSDARYIRVDGKPLFVVYNACAIPDLHERLRQWRAAARRHGIEDLYLCATLSVRNTLDAAALRAAGFDAVIDFMPRPDARGPRTPGNWLRYLAPRAWNKLLRATGRDRDLPLASVTNRFAYPKLMQHSMRRWRQDAELLPCVVPSWDNAARKRVDADVYQNNDPVRYGHWLSAAVQAAARRNSEQQLVFINAWNEWAEGCHLEPDIRHGLAFLEQTRAVLARGCASAGSPDHPRQPIDDLVTERG